MPDNRDITERLEDPSYDGAIDLRQDAAKEIRALRYYVALLEDQRAKAETDLDKAQDYISKQALDIVTLGQEVGRLHGVLANIAHADVPRPIWKRFRTDGQLSKNDTCPHVLAMWDDCPDCISDYARAALAEKGEK